VWIHTFVPGLPLSLLDHSLVTGNSLIGVATVEEARAKVSRVGSARQEDRTMQMFSSDAESLLGAAARPLKRLATLADASVRDVQAARTAAQEAIQAVAPTCALFDIITAQVVAGEDIRFQFDEWERKRDSLAGSRVHRDATTVLKGLSTLHFPVAFPEVFLRDRPGFDVIIGNPPWEEATIEEDAFWARHFPGLRSLPQREQEQLKSQLRDSRPDLVRQYQVEVSQMERLRKLLVGGGYPGMGTGDPDLYKAFCWRFWQLIANDGGRIGVVLPRSALTAKGTSEFRKGIFSQAGLVELTTLLNRAGWVFDEAEHRYTIALVVIAKGNPSEKSVHLRGPFSSLLAFEESVCKPASEFGADEVLLWNDTASLPLLPSEGSLEVFAQLRKSPRFDLNDGTSWRARPDSELHATNDKPLMDLESANRPKGFWPIFKGESFDIWTPDTGSYYAWGDPKTIQQRLLEKRVKSGKSRRDSVHAEFSATHLRDTKTLPCHEPRIAFRDISRATDTRTMRVTLLPPKIFLANTAPYLLWPRGDEKDQAFLLGTLSSIPLDWYARRFVETHLNFFVLNPFPIPRPPRTDIRWLRVVELAGRLAARDLRFAKWAKAVGVENGPLDDADKLDMIIELDAVVAHLYGLTADQLEHIFETFHEGWDYGERFKATLQKFIEWKDGAK